MRQENKAAPPEQSTPLAVLTGNRAGIVESADDAWTKLTGFPVHQTLHKPITHFLDHAGIDLEVVDLVGQNFREGRPSSVEFPFETATGKKLRIHLTVESLRDGLGEVSAFRATAHAVHPPVEDSLPSRLRRVPSGSPRRPRTRVRGNDRIDLLELASRVSMSWKSRRGASLMMDSALDPELPALQSDAQRLEALLEHLLDSANAATHNACGCITILSGRTRKNRSHRSKAHPIAVRPANLAHRSYTFLEVHDTAPHLSRDAIARIQNGSPGKCPREIALDSASSIAEEIGLALHFDSTAGCGTQALLLFPN